ncbi:MAG: SDR family oxidoreductase [Actinobacteria bacterium]|uniref:Unannotated protein n=1 Tax=freshwater metagenome TaxID=449393 RepID=A0A6J7GIR2_9ZZZZ|nr:SDR family oxidoreductase [Actinomycetota bacterium]MTB27453.1 SDR family oxidoreductase [Actinomycetota bacterium]
MDLPENIHTTRLAGRVALVTGGGGEGEFLGLGATTAILLAAQGAKVGVFDFSQERAAHTVALIESFGGEAVVIEGDVTDPASCVRGVEQVVKTYGALTTMVNNAAIVGEGGTIVDGDLVNWSKVIDVNLYGVMHMSRASIPAIRAAGGGSVINISSIAGIRAMGGSAYTVAKGAVQAMTRELALAHGREGIRVNTVLPGHIYSPMGSSGGEEMRELRRRSGMLGTEGNPWDIAWAVSFFASDESRWITATELAVDAGTTQTTAMPMFKYTSVIE